MVDDGPDPLIGHRLGNFTITGPLGKGGMGVVYVAQHVTLPTKAAVKVLLGELARDRDLVRRFLDEAHVASSINDPNVVRVFDAGQLDDGRPYLVMELLDGKSLHHVLQEGPLSLLRGLKILRQVASALSVVHSFGILHRDLKPENVHLGRDSKGQDLAKVLDFGLAKPQGLERGVTTAGTVVGTPEYMSPEQAQGHPLDKRSDIYSFGCIAYATITGVAPFDADSAIGLLFKHVSEPAPDCRIKRGEAPASLSALIARCMAKKLDDRPQTMDEVVQTIDDIVSEIALGVGSGPTVAVAIAGTALATSAPLSGSSGSSGSGTQKSDAVTQPVAPPNSAPRSNASGMSAALSTSEMAPVPPRSTSKALPLVLVLLVLFGAGIGAFFYARGTNAKGPAVAASGSASASVAISEEKNPFTINDRVAVSAGSGLWTSQCARCHGERGDGKGEKVPEGARPRSFNDVVLPPGVLDLYYFTIVRHGVV